MDVMAAVRDCCFDLVDHPPYSPDLAPSDYYLFPNMNKKHLAGSSIGRMIRSLYLHLSTFSRIMMRASIPRESKRYNTDGRRLCGPQGRLCCKTNHIQNRPLHSVARTQDFFFKGGALTLHAGRDAASPALKKSLRGGGGGGGDSDTLFPS